MAVVTGMLDPASAWANVPVVASASCTSSEPSTPTSVAPLTCASRVPS